MGSEPRSLIAVLSFVSIWLWLAVLLRMLNQVLMKHASQFIGGTEVSAMIAFLSFLIVGLLLMRAYCWQRALERHALSFAYPFTGLTLIGLLLTGYFFFDESISITNIVGVCFILLGIFVISSEKSMRRED